MKTGIPKAGPKPRGPGGARAPGKTNKRTTEENKSQRKTGPGSQQRRQGGPRPLGDRMARDLRTPNNTHIYAGRTHGSRRTLQPVLEVGVLVPVRIYVCHSFIKPWRGLRERDDDGFVGPKDPCCYVTSVEATTATPTSMETTYFPVRDKGALECRAGITQGHRGPP